jgi:hypothetical protein
MNCRVELLTLDRKLIEILYEGDDEGEAVQVAVSTVRRQGGLLVDSRMTDEGNVLELLKGN